MTSLILAAAVLVGTGAVPAASATLPTLSCRLSAAGACPEGGICIDSKIASDLEIIFDLERKRFRSRWGKGRLTQVWTRPDGTTGVVAAAPPASAHLTFAADFTSAKMGDRRENRTYACKRVR